LIDSPSDYNIVSEIEKYYNFRSGINYELKKRFGRDKKLKASKDLGDVVKFKSGDRYMYNIPNNENKTKTVSYV